MSLRQFTWISTPKCCFVWCMPQPAHLHYRLFSAVPWVLATQACVCKKWWRRVRGWRAYSTRLTGVREGIKWHISRYHNGCNRLNCDLNLYVKVSTLKHLRILVGDWLFKEETEVIKWALIPNDWGPYRKRLGHRHTMREDYLWITIDEAFTRCGCFAGEDGQLRAKERSLRRNQLCWHFNLRLIASRTVKK